MKVSVLVAQYFYQERELNLPGIGTFYLDDAVTVPNINDKNFRDFLQYIQFKQKTITAPDPSFIDFIRKLTGKIKPLAESDLESYVSDGKLLLNIGKPFHIEGIGTLHKNKLGVYEFTPGEPMMQRLEAISNTVQHKEKETTDKGEKATASKSSKKKSVFDEDYYPHESKGNNSLRQLLIAAGVLVGLTVIVWGGYSLYNKKMHPAAAMADNNLNESQPVDTAALQRADSLARVKAIADSIEAARNAPPGHYKFILETTSRKNRALPRYKSVNEISPRIQMEALNDSSVYKIYVILPAPDSDTSRLKDSLNAWYYGTWPSKIKIEH